MSESPRDVMEYDVAIVGAGPAGLACAIRLKQLKPALNICVLEKAASLGAHSLSGAVLEPGPLDELLPDWRSHPPAVCVPAARDEFLFMTHRKRYRLPTPPQMANHGNFIISLGQLVPILGLEAEKTCTHNLILRRHRLAMRSSAGVENCRNSRRIPATVCVISG